MRQHGFDGVRAGLHVRVVSLRPSTSATLEPPNAKELLSIASPPAVPAKHCPGSTSANGGVAGSAAPTPTYGGNRRSLVPATLSPRPTTARPHPPAAPNR